MGLLHLGQTLTKLVRVVLGVGLAFMVDPVMGCETGGPSGYLEGVDSIGLVFDPAFSAASISTALGV
jgi:hypothetical protein